MAESKATTATAPQKPAATPTGESIGKQILAELVLILEGAIDRQKGKKLEESLVAVHLDLAKVLTMPKGEARDKELKVVRSTVDLLLAREGIAGRNNVNLAFESMIALGIRILESFTGVAVKTA